MRAGPRDLEALAALLAADAARGRERARAARVAEREAVAAAVVGRVDEDDVVGAVQHPEPGGLPAARALHDIAVDLGHLERRGPRGGPLEPADGEPRRGLCPPLGAARE